MRKSIYLFLFFNQVFCFAQSAFDKGNEHYRKNNFEEAVKCYEAVLKTRKQSAELYYNLGNAYYKLNKVAPAIYNYEKALLLDPGNSDINNNIKFAYNLRVDEIKVVPKIGSLKLSHSFTSVFDYNTWAWITVVLSVLFLGCFIGYYFSEIISSKRFFFAGMCFVFISLLVSIGFAFFQKKDFNREQPAIIFAEEVAVKEEPSQMSSDAFILHEGTKVFVLDTLEEWNKIKIEDGSQGWIVKNSIKKLK